MRLPCPRGVYDEAKRFSEAMTMAYHRYRGLDTRIVRIFNTYGPRMRPNDGRVVSNFIVQACSGQPLTIYGEGNQTRSFCYVEDTVAGIIKLLFQESNRTLDERTDRKRFLYGSAADVRQASIHEPVNIGNPEELTVKQLAQLIIKLTGSKVEVHHEPLPIDDPQVRRPDITKAQTLLGWSPVFTIEEGLTRTAQYFSTKLGSYAPTSAS